MSDSHYAKAGVNLRDAEAAKDRIGELVAETRTPLALGAIGAFGGMVRVPTGCDSPVLVMSTDGVGTKVLIAQQSKRYNSVGEDLVNHSVNDILVHGAQPIAFMDYIAGHQLPVEMIAGVVEGIARGCKAHDMTLAGGETAQMPGLYLAGTFDLAATIIGVVDEAKVIHGSSIAPGDVLIAYASSGLHTNGYTLAREVLFNKMNLSLDGQLPGGTDSVVDALLAVHRSYQTALQPVFEKINGMAHITGGGIAGNLVRILPDNVDAVVETSSWQWPTLFQVIAEGGKVSDAEMREVFNLGVGMIAVVSPSNVEAVRASARSAGDDTWILGEMMSGTGTVRMAD